MIGVGGKIEGYFLILNSIEKMSIEFFINNFQHLAQTFNHMEN